MLCEKIYTKIEHEIEVEYDGGAYEAWKSVWNKLRNLKTYYETKACIIWRYIMKQSLFNLNTYYETKANTNWRSIKIQKLMEIEHQFNGKSYITFYTGIC